MTTIARTDITIIGAGMVGASLVHLLRPALAQGLTVTLVERQQLRADGDFAQRPPSFDGRATALSFGTQQMLEQLGVWDLMRERACAIEHIQVSDLGRFGQTHLHAAEQKTAALGYIVENAVIGQALLNDLQQTGVSLKAPAQVERVQMNVEGALLTFADGQQLQTKLLVLADGARSNLAQQLGIQHERRDYGTHALVTQVRVDRSHGHWAYERFTDNGPVAFLPLNKNDFAVVWTLPNNEIEWVKTLSDADFIARLQAIIGHRVGAITAVGERASYPLALVQSKEQVRRSLVLLGNAAHSLHPVAGQGFNLALRDAAALAEHINNAFAADVNVGDLAMLQAYEQQQATDQFNTIHASDLLPRVFGSKLPAVSWLRNLGLLALSAMPTARKLFARHAMGLGQKRAEIDLNSATIKDSL